MGNVVLQKCSSATNTDAINNFKRFVNGNGPFRLTAKDLDGITEIPDGAFENCKYLISIELPSSMLSIGDRAFYGCSNLESLTSASHTLNNLQHVGVDAFTGCDKLQIGKPVYTFVTDHYRVSFPWQDGTIGKLVCVPTIYNGYIVSDVYANDLINNTFTAWVNLPSTLSRIGARGLGAMTNLESISIPKNATSIDMYAFSSDHNLSSVSFSKNVISIGEGAFNQCWGLTSINYDGTIAEWNLISLGQNWNYNTGNYTIYCTNGEIAKDGTITYYPTEGLAYTLNQDGQSYSCSGAGTATDADIIIASTYSNLPVTSVSNSAFYNNSSLASVTIPDSVTSIGYEAFYNCRYLTSAIIPNSMTSIGGYAFNKCYNLTSITIPNSVTSIGSYAFSDCFCLGHVTIGNGVTSIGEGVFSGSTSLASITIPSSVTSIGLYAFRGCSGLISITIPSSVTSIGDEAFSGCYSFTSINYNGTVANWGSVAKGADWDYNTGNYTIYCTNGEIAKDGTITYYPTEGLAYTLNQDGQSYSCTGIGTATDIDIVIASTYSGLPVTSIGSSAFWNCTGLTSIMIPSSVTSIGGNAFGICTGLTSIIIPDSVTSMGNRVFYNCTGLTSVTISNSVTSIGGGAFEYCTGLTSVTIPSGVASIGGGAFLDCYGLTSVAIPGSVTSIGDGAFDGCYNLTSINYNDTIANWGSISKWSGWDRNTGNYVIHCTDGDIPKQQ